MEQIFIEQVDLIFKIMSTIVECDCMALRLADKNGDFPFFTYKGYSNEFINAEKSVFNNENKFKDCLCGQIIKGPSDEIKKYFTEYGSIYFNADTKEQKKELKKKLSGFNERCILESPDSSAFIPIKYNGKCSGMFYLSDYNKNTFNEENITIYEEAASYLAQIIFKNSKREYLPKKKYKILIADDEVQIGSILKRLLEKFGNICTAVSDGEMALEYILNNKIDLLISDINMPKMSGLQLIRKLRRKYEIYGPKVIITTGSLNSINKNFILKNNISHIIAKPFENIMEIPEIVNNVFANEHLI